ncbi:MAG: hypothetical protein AAFX00_13365, partial [Pseudomonadota bacterium]
MAFQSLFVPALDTTSLQGSLSDAQTFLGDRPGYVRAHYVVDTYRPPATMADAVNLSQLVDAQRQQARDMERTLREAFDLGVANFPDSVRAEFTAGEGEVPRGFARAARVCGLTLYRHRGKDMRAFDPINIEELLFHSGRPLLLVPEQGMETAPSSIAVAWNGSRQAARALALADPMIRDADRVAFLTIGKEREGSPSAEDMAAQVAGFGPKTEVIRGDGGKDVGDALARMAIENGYQA